MLETPIEPIQTLGKFMLEISPNASAKVYPS